MTAAEDLLIKLFLAEREGEHEFAAWLVREHEARQTGLPFDEPAPLTECDRRIAYHYAPAERKP